MTIFLRLNPGLLLGVLCLSPLGLRAQGEALPPPAIGEIWRWHHLEALDAVIAYCGTEGPEGRLWLASEGAVYAYDGRELEPFPSPEALPRQVPNRIFVGADGVVYCRTLRDIRILEAGIWRILLEVRSPPNDHARCFAQVDPETVVIASDGGLFLYRRATGRLTRWVEEPAKCVLNDGQGHLWYVDGRGRRAHRMELTGEALVGGGEGESFALGFNADSRVEAHPLASEPSSFEIRAGLVAVGGIALRRRRANFLVHRQSPWNGERGELGAADRLGALAGGGKVERALRARYAVVGHRISNAPGGRVPPGSGTLGRCSPHIDDKRFFDSDVGSRPIGRAERRGKVDRHRFQAVRTTRAPRLP